MPKLSIKTDITKTIKSLEAEKKKLAEATIVSLGQIAESTFKKMEEKYVTSQEYMQNETYTRPPNADIPKTRNTKNGKVLTKTNFFSSKKIISRVGGLLDSIKSLASTTFDRIGTWKTDDYEVKISSNKVKISYVSDKAATLERKRSPKGPARKIVYKAGKAVISVWKKAWKKVFNK